MDLAYLGIKIDTQDVKTAGTSLDGLAKQAGKAETATDKLRRAFVDTSEAAGAKKDAIRKIISALQEQDRSIRMSKSELLNYKLSMLGASRAEKEAAQSILARTEALVKAKEKTNDLKESSLSLGSAIKYVAGAFALWKIADYIKDSALAGSRYETLGVVMGVVGRNAGISARAMEDNAVALQKSGISMMQSRDTTIKLVQAHIDLAHSQKLARIAQDAAVIGGINSSEALGRMVYGIQTAQIEVLKTIGINVNFENSYKKLAAQLGKTAGDLTEQEKLQARLNVVMERGSDIAGTYEAAMTTSGKKITSFTRYLEDFAVKMGNAFGPAVTMLVDDATDAMKKFTKEIESEEAQAGLRETALSIAEIARNLMEMAKTMAGIAKYAGLRSVTNTFIEGTELAKKGLIDFNVFAKANFTERQRMVDEVNTRMQDAIPIFHKIHREAPPALGSVGDAADSAADKTKRLKKELTEASKALRENMAYASKMLSINDPDKSDPIKEFEKNAKAMARARTKAEAEIARDNEAARKKLFENDFAYMRLEIDLQRDGYEKLGIDKVKIEEWYTAQVMALADKRADYDAKQKKSGADQLKKDFEDLEKLTKFEGQSFGNEMADGINNAVISMQSLIDMQGKHAKAIEKIVDLRTKADSTTDLKERQKILDEVGENETNMIKGQLSGYRQLFGTTSQLFKENSKEREALHNIEMAFAMAEIAMNLEKAVSAAVVAIATQGSGDPYSAFARIAAMAALMGGVLAMAGGSLGGSVSGGSVPGGQTAATTGTVFGNSSASSESSSKALELLEDMHNEDWKELSGIHKEMISLNQNISGITNSVTRNIGSFNAATMGITEGITRNDIQNKFSELRDGPWKISDMLSSWANGALIEGLLGGIFGKTSTTLQSAGIQTGGASVESLVGGGGVNTSAFANTKVERDRGWFGSASWIETTFKGVNAEVQDLFTKVFQNLGKSMVEISKGLGADNMEQVMAYMFDVQRIDLKGLTGEALEKKLTEWVSTQGDKAVEKLFGTLIQKYQKIDEGMLETAVRLVGEKDAVLDILKMTNAAFEGTTWEAVEFSQVLIGIAGDLEKLAGAASTYFDKFFTDDEKLDRLKNNLTSVFSGIDIEMPNTRDGFRAIIEGLDMTTESGQRAYVALINAADLADQYYTGIEDGQQKMVDLANKRFDLEMQILNLTGQGAEATRLIREKELAAMEESLRPLQERIWTLQDEATAARDAKDAAKEKLNQAEDILRKAVDSQIQIYQDLADKANENLSKAEDLLRRSFAAEEETITKKHEALIAGLTERLDEANDAAGALESTFDSLRSARKNMRLAGSEQKTYAAARGALSSALTSARSGDFSKAADLSDSLGTLSEDNQKFYSTFTDYQRDYFKTYNSIAELEKLTGTGLTEQQQVIKNLEDQIELENLHHTETLDLMKKQLDKLLGVDSSVVSVEQAVRQFQAAQNAADGANTLLKTQTAQLNTMIDRLLGIDNSVRSVGWAIQNFLNSQGEYNSLPGYAAGGTFPGGLRIVGEKGPEIEYTGPSLIYSNSQSKALLDNSELVKEIQELKAIIKQGNYAIAKNTLKASKTLEKFDYDGLPAERAS